MIMKTIKGSVTVKNMSHTAPVQTIGATLSVYHKKEIYQDLIIQLLTQHGGFQCEANMNCQESSPQARSF